MSLHSSLKTSAVGKGGTQRSVLKRFERIRWLLAQSKWTSEQSVFGLPKIKQLKIKARKAAPKEAVATAETGAAAAETPDAKAAVSPAAKPASKPSK